MTTKRRWVRAAAVLLVLALFCCPLWLGRPPTGLGAASSKTPAAMVSAKDPAAMTDAELRQALSALCERVAQLDSRVRRLERSNRLRIIPVVPK